MQAVDIAGAIARQNRCVIRSRRDTASRAFQRQAGNLLSLLNNIILIV
jgi:hypothetical protein